MACLGDRKKMICLLPSRKQMTRLDTANRLAYKRRCPAGISPVGHLIWCRIGRAPDNRIILTVQNRPVKTPGAAESIGYRWRKSRAMNRVACGAPGHVLAVADWRTEGCRGATGGCVGSSTGVKLVDGRNLRRGPATGPGDTGKAAEAWTITRSRWQLRPTERQAEPKHAGPAFPTTGRGLGGFMGVAHSLAPVSRPRWSDHCGVA